MRDDLRTCDAPEVRACDEGATGHDFRRFEDPDGGVYMRCVWCRGVSCGDVGMQRWRFCVRAWHHHDDHRNAAGTTWPKGGEHPEEAAMRDAGRWVT